MDIWHHFTLPKSTVSLYLDLCFQAEPERKAWAQVYVVYVRSEPGSETGGRRTQVRLHPGTSAAMAEAAALGWCWSELPPGEARGGASAHLYSHWPRVAPQVLSPLQVSLGLACGRASTHTEHGELVAGERWWGGRWEGRGPGELPVMWLGSLEAAEVGVQSVQGLLVFSCKTKAQTGQKWFVRKMILFED